MNQFGKNLIREPLLHFLLIGAGLFFLFGWRSGPAALPAGQAGPPSAEIFIGQGDIDQLAGTFQRTWQRPPTEEEVQGLIDSFVRDEIYYREALALGLDRDDSVIKRRLRMKMEYIFEDIAAQGEPTEAELEAFFQKNGERYRLDPQRAFRHVYVNIDKRRENAETDARHFLAKLNKGIDPATVGDPFLQESEIGPLSLREIRDQFGAGFADSLIELKPGRWEGPVRSGYGLHLVLVTSAVEEQMPLLHEMRDIVKRDWAAARQMELRDAAYARLRERYTVVREKPQSHGSSSVAAADRGRTSQ
jgi:hypothetical protein